MKICLRRRVSMVVWTLTLVAGVGNFASAEERAAVPRWLARFDEQRETLRTLFLYAESDLRSVYVRLHGSWVPAKRVKEPSDEQRYFVYRLTSRFVPAADSKLILNSWTADRTNTFRHRLHIEQDENDLRVRGELVGARSRDEYLVDRRAQARTSDPYGFIPLLNAYRARRGLRGVTYCTRLAEDARINNSRSAPHAYMGRASVQNWAEGFGSAAGVLRGWQQSPGHNRNLLSPGITRVGIAYSHGEWTFNGG